MLLFHLVCSMRACVRACMSVCVRACVQVGLEDAVHTALLTLKDGFEGQVSIAPQCTVHHGTAPQHIIRHTEGSGSKPRSSGPRLPERGLCPARHIRPRQAGVRQGPACARLPHSPPLYLRFDVRCTCHASGPGLGLPGGNHHPSTLSRRFFACPRLMRCPLLLALRCVVTAERVQHRGGRDRRRQEVPRADGGRGQRLPAGGGVSGACLQDARTGGAA